MNNTLFSSSFRFLELRMEKYHHTDNRKGAPHHYIGFMRSGHARIVSEKRTIEIQEGQPFYIPKDLPYQSYWYGEDLIRFDSYGFDLLPVLENRSYQLQLLPQNPEILALIDQLAADKRVCCRSLGIFFTLLSKLLPDMETDITDRSRQLLEAAEAYFYQHPDAQVADVAKHCGISESGLYAAFSRSANTTPNELRQRILADKATDLLTSTDIPIEEISSRLNFSSTSYFRKVLKKHTGKTPSEIRNQPRL